MDLKLNAVYRSNRSHLFYVHVGNGLMQEITKHQYAHKMPLIHIRPGTKLYLVGVNFQWK